MRMFANFCMIFLVFSLSACGDSGLSELQEWMSQVKKEASVRVTPLTEPKVFIPVAYNGKELIDPFDPSKLLVVFARMKAENDNGLKPDFDRPKEALEGYALDGMKMVGTFDNRKNLQGLVQIGKAVFPVVVGGYIGQNFGRVISINEARIDLVEVVQDATGEWTERKASLELQEAKK
jgi:type IV pilus assembly protein PilP